MSQQFKQQENGFLSQQMDDLFDIFIQSGEILVDFKELLFLLGKEKLFLKLVCGFFLVVQLLFFVEFFQVVLFLLGLFFFFGCLEDFLESSMGLFLLISGYEGLEFFFFIDDFYSQMLSSIVILDYFLLFMDILELYFVFEFSSIMGLDLVDGYLDSMDWLELLLGGFVLSLVFFSIIVFSFFFIDFFDGYDLQLYWDFCLQFFDLRLGMGKGLGVRVFWCVVFLCDLVFLYGCEF